MVLCDNAAFETLTANWANVVNDTLRDQAENTMLATFRKTLMRQKRTMAQKRQIALDTLLVQERTNVRTIAFFVVVTFLSSAISSRR